VRHVRVEQRVGGAVAGADFAAELPRLFRHARRFHGGEFGRARSARGGEGRLRRRCRRLVPVRGGCRVKRHGTTAGAGRVVVLVAIAAAVLVVVVIVIVVVIVALPAAIKATLVVVGRGFLLLRVNVLVPAVILGVHRVHLLAVLVAGGALPAAAAAAAAAVCFRIAVWL